MNRQLILYKKKDQVIPRAYAAACLAQFPTCIGFTVQDTEDGKSDGTPFLEIDRSPKSTTIEQFMKLQETAKHLNIVFTLGNITGEFNKEHDIQPFSFQTPDKQDILSVNIEGDFPDFVQKGHSEERNLWVDYVHPLMFKEYEASEDLGSFYEKLATPIFKRQLMGSVGHRASIVMLPIIGDPIAHEKNELVVEYPWGACSQGTEIDRSLEPAKVPGKKVEKTEEKPVEAKKSGRFKDILNTDSGEKAPAPLPADDKTVVHNTPEPAKEVKVETSAAALDAGFMEVGPPEKLQGKALNFWYRTFNNGGLPSNSHKRPTIRVPIALGEYATRKISTKDEAQKLQSEVKAILGIRNTADQMKEAHAASAVAEQQVEKVDNTPEPEQKTEKTTSSAVKSGDSDPSKFMPILKDVDVNKVQDVILDYATRDAAKFPTPLQLQKAEEKFPSFSSRMGIKFEDMFRWRVEDIKHLGQLSSDALAMAFIEMRANMRSHVSLDNIIPANAEPAKTPEPTKVEKETAKHVAAKEVLKPEVKAGNDPMDFLKRPLKKAAA